jgi:phosphocarrier protein FPr
MVTGAGPAILEDPEGTMVALDATAGRVTIRPDKEERADVEAKAKARRRTMRRAVKAARKPARMAESGPTIAVMANIGSVDDAIAAADAGADGCGLVRTEFLFHGAEQAPGQTEQEEIYRAIAEAMGGRKVIFRTLDAGGDKPLPYAPIAPEANPFLGVRGIRLSLAHPGMLAEQLAALIAVARDFPIGIMFPMVADISEMRQARILTARAAFAQGGGVPSGLNLGMMVEVPSVAMKAAAFAPMVDFFSIGTNDLTQYSLAVDRGNPAVASLADGLDPGMLGLIRALCRSARGKATVSVCGELGSDPVAVPVLLGLGVRSLSVAVPTIAEVKEVVRSVSKARARLVARQALACSEASAVRQLLRSASSWED